LAGDWLSSHVYPYDPTISADLLRSKVEFLQSLTRMPLIISETALLCKPEWECGVAFRQRQAEYLTNVYNFGYDVRIDKLIWYSQNDVGWNSCNMVKESTGIRHPVWYSFVQNIGVP